MSGYLIGEVCRLLDVKPHVLRYWEQQVPLLSPRKDRVGRRIYSPREVQILFRLRYLIVHRRLTTEGASRKILEEVQGVGADLKAELHQLRESLLGLQRRVRAAGAAGERLLAPPEGGEEVASLSDLWPGLSPARRIAAAADLARWKADPWRYAALPADCASAADLRVFRWRRPELQHYFPDSGGRLRVAVVVHARPSDGVAALRTTITTLAAHLGDAADYGVAVSSWIVAAEGHQLGDPAALLRFCSARAAVRAPVNLLDVHPLPLRDDAGCYVLDAGNEGLAARSRPLLSVVRELSRRQSLAESCDAVLICATGAHREGPPPIELLAWFDPRRSDAVAVAVREPVGDDERFAVRDADAARRYRCVGPAVISVALLRSVAASGRGRTVSVAVPVFRESLDPDDVRTEQLHGPALGVVDLLAAARRPRLFSTGGMEWHAEYNGTPA